MAREEYPTLTALKPSKEVLCSFIDYHCILKKIDTVKGYIKRANTVARDMGSKGGLTKKEWKRDIGRTYRAAAKRFKQVHAMRRPLDVPTLKKIKPLLDPHSHNDRALWALLCVGIFTLARIGELVPSEQSRVKVTREAVNIRGDHGTLSLVGTKTDSERKGVTMHFFRSGGDCCPVTAMSAYLTGRSAGAKAPLFVDETGRRMTQKGVIDRVRSLLDQIGLKGAEFSGISLRRGGAQTLLRLGASDKVIMALGRWKTECFRRYLTVEEQDVKQWQLNMSKA